MISVIIYVHGMAEVVANVVVNPLTPVTVRKKEKKKKRTSSHKILRSE